jgi:Tfp pilus assembly protein PilE
MKLLTIIIAAGALSGAAYGQLSSDAWVRQEEARQIEANRQLQERMQRQEEWMATRRAEAAAAQQREQLDEIQAQQRQIHYELENRQLFEEQRCRPQPFWVRPWDLECE